MKTQFNKVIKSKMPQIILAVMITIGLSACGKQNSASNVTQNQSPFNGYNGYNNLPAGCIPLSPNLSFSVQNASVNDVMTLAGSIPASFDHAGNWGQVRMNSVYNSQYSQQPVQYGQPGTIIMNKASVNGSLSLNMVAPGYQMGNMNYPGAPANITGTLQLSQQVLSALQSQSGYLATPYNGSPYGQVAPYTGAAPMGYNPYSQATCITSIGISIVNQIYPGYMGQAGSGIIYQAVLFLYLNNNTQPTPIVL